MQKAGACDTGLCLIGLARPGEAGSGCWFSWAATGNKASVEALPLGVMGGRPKATGAQGAVHGVNVIGL
jgi:hypothetical protein